MLGITSVTHFPESAQAAVTLLVVDDDPAIRHICAEVLRGEGYEVATARHGRDALAQLAERPVDLVLMDILMPELDGIAACTAIKADPRLCAIPVVLMTASSTLRDLPAPVRDSIAAIVVKPFDLDKLLQTIETALAARSVPALSLAAPMSPHLTA
jgi:CheY-like chemotaxis protein